MLLCSALSLSGQVGIGVSLDTTDILIGDHVRVNIQLSIPSGYEIQSFDYSGLEATESIELLDMGKVLTVAEQPELLLEQHLTLTSYDSGYHRFQPLALVVNGPTGLDTLYSSDLAFSVSTIPVGEDDPLRGNKDIIEEPIDWRDYLPYAIALLVVLAILLPAWYFAKREAKAKVRPAPPPPPAHEVALSKLRQIEQAAVWKKGEIKQYQSDLTYVLREYLENRFGLTALESTTGEINQQWNEVPEISSWRGRLIALLQLADMVKFAKAIPEESVHEEGLQTVKTFVEQTHYVAPAVEEEEE